MSNRPLAARLSKLSPLPDAAKHLRAARRQLDFRSHLQLEYVNVVSRSDLTHATRNRACL